MFRKPVPFTKHKSLSGWEISWQKCLDIMYIKTPIAALNSIRNAGAGNSTSEQAITAFKSTHYELCQLQLDLLHFATEKCTEDDFERKWLEAGSKAREIFYFEAMKRVCDMPNMENNRIDAPEISLRNFQEKSGQGYLDLLRSLPPEQLAANRYIRIQHPAFDAQFGIRNALDTGNSILTDPIGFNFKFFDVTRCLFISLVVWQTLLAFYGLSGDVISVRTERRHDIKLTPTEQDRLRRSGIDPVAYLKEHKRKQKQAVWMCTNCEKPESDFTDHTFKSCGNCREIQRNVMYCSRECQIDNWKNGNPPHKTICGKRTTELPPAQPSIPSSSTSRRTFPPPAPNYRRSISLLKQIDLLEKQPSVDYFVLRPAPLPVISMTFGHAGLADVFHGMRDHAFSTGDKGAVGVMYTMLDLMRQGRSEAGFDRLENQLGREFGMSLEELQEQKRLADEMFLSIILDR